MGAGAGVEVVALDGAREALAAGDAGDIDDLTFRFYVTPKDGNGSLQTDNTTPAKAIYQNFVTYPNGNKFATGGTADVIVRAMSDGRELWNTSLPLTMTMDPAPMPATPVAATPSPVPSPWP